MKKGGLYIIWMSDKHYYGGRTVDFDGRWKTHLRLFRRGIHPNHHAQAVYNIYGVFRPEILVDLPPEDQLDAERAWLDEHFGRSECLNVWNSAQGTHKGWHHSEATKEKFRQRRFSDETKKAWSESRKGHPVSDDTREKCSQALKGKKRPDVVDRNKDKAGWHHTPEARQKISDAGRKRTHVVSEDARRKISESLRGKKQSPETIQKRIESVRKARERKKEVGT